MKIFRIITILILSFIITINSQENPFILLLSEQSIIDTEKCKAKGENGVKQFSDCETESNYDNQQICCLIYGTNSDGTSYRGCIAMNSTMFYNKSVSYKSSTISGTVICTDYFNLSDYYKYPLIFYLFLFIILF